MVAWWDALTTLERIFACIAIPATLILLLQTVLLLFGLGSDFDGDMSADNDHDSTSVHDPGLQIFTVRGFIAFFAVFGWGGLVCLKAGAPPLVTFAISAVLGLISMVVIALIFMGFMMLQSDGTADLNTAIGSTGTVYISIPPKRSGTGKVNLMVSGTWTEVDACTDADRKLKTDESVTVVAIAGDSKLVVMPQYKKGN